MMRVIGSVKIYDGKVHIMAYDASPIVDFNEVILLFEY
jgi:hypothetical protein